MKKDFLSISDINNLTLDAILSETAVLKDERQRGIKQESLSGKSLAMIFEKASTRTRIAFEVGMFELGGHAIFLTTQDMQLNRGEEIRDTARVLSRYVSAIMLRAYHHQTLEEFAQFSSVPVINGLSDREHPCQILADIFTIKEHFNTLKGIKIAWIGDGNNVCNSLLLSTPLTGIELTIASPHQYLPNPKLVASVQSKGGNIHITDSPEEAADNANVLYTDVWVSMGDEKQRKSRVNAFQGYTLDMNLVSLASSDAIIMHCLPAHRGEEITDEVIESKQSVVWDQAENRLHTQKALLKELLLHP